LFITTRHDHHPYQTSSSLVQLSTLPLVKTAYAMLLMKAFHLPEPDGCLSSSGRPVGFLSVRFASCGVFADLGAVRRCNLRRVLMIGGCVGEDSGAPKVGRSLIGGNISRWDTLALAKRESP
jgi:hypothetical protein